MQVDNSATSFRISAGIYLHAPIKLLGGKKSSVGFHVGSFVILEGQHAYLRATITALLVENVLSFHIEVKDKSICKLSLQLAHLVCLLRFFQIKYF